MFQLIILGFRDEVSVTEIDYLFQLLCFLKLHTYTRVQVLSLTQIFSSLLFTGYSISHKFMYKPMQKVNDFKF